MSLSTTSDQENDQSADQLVNTNASSENPPLSVNVFALLGLFILTSMAGTLIRIWLVTWFAYQSTACVCVQFCLLLSSRLILILIVFKKKLKKMLLYLQSCSLRRWVASQSDASTLANLLYFPFICHFTSPLQRVCVAPSLRFHLGCQQHSLNSLV